jgi:hypothetical protein
MAARVEIIQHDNVPADGNLGDGSHLPVDGSTVISPPDGSCGVPGCACFRGHFLLRLFARDEARTVFGYVVEFETRHELESMSEEMIARLAQNAMN